jgi:CTP synthase
MTGRSTKYIFVTGGVVSSIGKGLTSAALGSLLEARGLKVTAVKLDPYINVDPGTMSPFQHGEVFVTDDGAETDLDLGHYERFLQSRMTKANNFTAGQVYESVIQAERRGDYLGGTVQVIPHITDEIKRRVHVAAEGFDICICEVGGTVGDIESLPFIEAIRQLRQDHGTENTVFVHVTLVPYISAAHEFKSKPTQHSVNELTGFGIQPNIIVLRSEEPLDEKFRKKVSLFCNVKENAVINAYNVSSIYELPILLKKEGLDERVTEYLNIWTPAPSLAPWERIANTLQNPPSGVVTITMVGKYTDLTESYKSLTEALYHGGFANDCKVAIEYVDSEAIEKDGVEAAFSAVRCVPDAILIPGGFGDRGSEGKIQAIRYAREQGIPFFGICLGLQMAVIEFARNVAGIKNATSREFSPNGESCVIDIMESQRQVQRKGGSMRLGAYPCALKDSSLARKLYGAKEISERHRHRFEVNNSYRSTLEQHGLSFSGTSPDDALVEIIELPAHPWFLGTQYHPEFKSKPQQPHPLFSGFIRAALNQRAKRDKGTNTTSHQANDEDRAAGGVANG